MYNYFTVKTRQWWYLHLFTFFFCFFLQYEERALPVRTVKNYERKILPRYLLIWTTCNRLSEKMVSMRCGACFYTNLWFSSRCCGYNTCIIVVWQKNRHRHKVTRNQFYFYWHFEFLIENCLLLSYSFSLSRAYTWGGNPQIASINCVYARILS